jgi:hypothetical protein
MFYFIVQHHLSYSVSSPVPLTKYSILQNVLFNKNVDLSDEIWIRLKPLPFFHVICGSYQSHKNRESTSHHQQSPMRVEGIHTTGSWPVPWRDRLWHCYRHLSAMQPSVRCLTPWLQWTRALFTVLTRPPPLATLAHRVRFWRAFCRIMYVLLPIIWRPE